MQEPTPEPTPAGAEVPAAPRRGRGGRPRHAHGTVRTDTIGVRVTPAEHATLRSKAESLASGQPVRSASQDALQEFPPC